MDSTLERNDYVIFSAFSAHCISVGFPALADDTNLLIDLTKLPPDLAKQLIEAKQATE